MPHRRDFLAFSGASVISLLLPQNAESCGRRRRRRRCTCDSYSRYSQDAGCYSRHRGRKYVEAVAGKPVEVKVGDKTITRWTWDTGMYSDWLSRRGAISAPCWLEYDGHRLTGYLKGCKNHNAPWTIEFGFEVKIRGGPTQPIKACSLNYGEDKNCRIDTAWPKPEEVWRYISHD